MPLHRNLALLGLPPGDRHLLERLLLGAKGEAGFEIVHDLQTADLIISNADDGNVVRKLQARGLSAPVLLIGDSDAGTGWPLLVRPLSTDALVAAIGKLTMAPARSAGAASASPVVPMAVPAGASWRPHTGGFATTEPFAEADFPSTRHSPLSARSAPSAAPGLPPPSAPLTSPVPSADARHSTPVPTANSFQATVPFAALEASDVSATHMSKPVASAPVAQAIETRIATSLASGSSGVSPREIVPPALAQDVLMWRDGPPAAAAPESQRATAPVSKSARGDSDSYWTSNLEAGTMDHPTRPQGLGGEPSASILLVGGPRLAGGSLMKALRGFGHRVDHAPDGGGALSRLAARDYHFVFLDHAALGISTLSLCRSLRRHDRALRVIVIAAQGSWLQRMLARSAGVDAWMIKPLVKKRLQNYLRKRIDDKFSAAA